MANNPRAFRIEMYEEHLEEASFLYEQRLGLLDDPELSWIDLRPFEARLEAHLDALVVGGELALSVCRRRALEGDAGELRAALSIFCRAGNPEELAVALEALDPEDGDRMRAAFEGLRLEMPEDWRTALSGCGAPGSRVGLQLQTQLAADRGWDPGPEARASLLDGPPRLRLAALRALSAARSADDTGAIAALLEDPDASVAREAARALLRMGQGQAMEWLRRRATRDPESATLLALGADRRSAVLLMEEMQREAGRAEAPAVLGLLGDPAAVPWLLERLREDAAAVSAAEALWMITGASLFEPVEIREEAHAQAGGTGSERARGEDDAGSAEEGLPAPARGVVVRRPAADPARWSAWWQPESKRFRPGVRHLLGQPASAEGLRAALSSADPPNRVRRLLWEQAVIRYGLRASFAADWPVEQQERRLQEIRSEARAVDARLAPGDWTFAGQA